jgi:hypothetical protein
MKNNRLQFITKIIFFGSIWGILEATLGYVLHFVPALISGSIMFPIVLFILYRAYKSLGSRDAILYIAMIAVMIKATNLFLPYLHPARTINPMVSMFLEASLVFAVIPMMESKKLSTNILGVVGASLVWRLLFVGYQALNYALTGYLAVYLSSVSEFLSFVVLYGLFGTVLSIGVLFILKKVSFKRLDEFKLNPAISMALLILAVVLTLTI